MPSHSTPKRMRLTLPLRARLRDAWRNTDWFEPLALTGLFICALISFLLLVFFLVQLP